MTSSPSAHAATFRMVSASTCFRSTTPSRGSRATSSIRHQSSSSLKLKMRFGYRHHDDRTSFVCFAEHTVTRRCGCKLHLRSFRTFLESHVNIYGVTTDMLKRTRATCSFWIHYKVQSGRFLRTAKRPFSFCRIIGTLQSSFRRERKTPRCRNEVLSV